MKSDILREVEKGETVTVSFELGYNELGFYGFDSKYAVEPGKFDIYVGTNCYADMTEIINVK